jgi:chromate transporter
VAGVLYGIKPVVIAVILQALWRLGPKAIKRSVPLAVLGAAACAAFALGVDAILVLVGGGVAWLLGRQLAGQANRARAIAPPLLAATAAAPVSAASISLLTLFLTFLKIGAVVFGSGYVLLAFLRTDLVDRLHWLTEPQLLDAVAIGQVTPGPVFTTATFIGYLVGSRAGAGSAVWGAVLATIGIFLPGFVLVALVRPLVARVRQSTAASAFLDGVNVAALALMAVVTVQLARTALVDVPTILIALAGALALIRFEVNTTWLVAGGALLGAAVHALR